MTDERKIIAEVLLENHALKIPRLAWLEPWNFEDERHVLIFASLKILEAAGEQITLKSVADFLREYDLLESAGGDDYLCSLVAEMWVMSFEPRGKAAQ